MGLTVLFGVFGLQLLRAAYGLDNPLHFVATFFSASLIILISAVFFLGLCFQLVHNIQAGRKMDQSDDSSPSKHP